MADFLRQLEEFVPRTPGEAGDRQLILQCIRAFGARAVLSRCCLAAHITASGYVMDPGRTQVLMAHHNIYKTWSWTGGHADGERDLLSVALREVREETGIRTLIPLGEAPASVEVLTVQSHWKRGAYVPSHLHLNFTYLMEAPPEQPLASRPSENSAVGWLPADRLREFCSEPFMVELYSKLTTYARERK